MSSKAEAYEKLGVFYLGRPWDADRGETAESPLLYDSRDLLTHAMCVGMTGSGKTGLCISLLEEAAIDGIPALIIDVKGDLGNLMLTFPDLAPEDFRPWIDEDAARRAGVEPDEFARSQADLWRNGLAGWDQDGERIRRLREAVDIAIYTPGSEAGRPISILSSFDAPPQEVIDDYDALQERVATTVSSLLGLLGIDADPLRSREHILLSNLLDRTWRGGRNIDLAGLIQAIQNPPVERIGVMPLDSFFPPEDRFELAMSINNLLAAPGFATWLSGEPLDVDKLLYDETGRPRLAIFSIAHLNDAERMFFVSLLLNQTLGWMRGQSGTSSLRALLYMDEIFGYLPPVANPPSKPPLLTLLKQARAFGLGVVLATQNPVDLDYKALSNIGTWFLGRLQTERDQQRVLDGLEGAAAEAGLDRRALEKLLGNLGKRIFLLHDVHEEGPVLFKVRWAMSYLRGPLTRSQIQQLMASETERAARSSSESGISPRTEAARAVRPVSPEAPGAGGERPLLPPAVPEIFLPVSGRPDAEVVYRPRLLGQGTVHFVDKKLGIEVAREVLTTVPLPDGMDEADWYAAEDLELSTEHLEDTPADGPVFETLPAIGGDAKAYRRFEKSFADMLYRARRLELFESPTYELVSKPGENERDFRIRLGDAARQHRDEEAETLRERTQREVEKLETRIRRAEEKLEREKAQASEHKLKSVLDLGTTLLGAFMGRKTFSKTNLRRVGSVAKGFGRSAKEGRDVDLAEDVLEDLVDRQNELRAELEQELAGLAERFDPQNETLSTRTLKPRRTDVRVHRVALAWAPWRGAEPSW